MASNSFYSEVPSWDGDPNSFERFATSCLWYSYGLKDNERHLAAARIWNKMSGPAKGVVRHLSPEEFVDKDGVAKLLKVLRDSPLQKLPIPDSFSRLEKWTGLQKRDRESIPQLIVREEELFTELQAALRRARDQGLGTLKGRARASTSSPRRPPPRARSRPTRRKRRQLLMGARRRALQAALLEDVRRERLGPPRPAVLVQHRP